MHGNSGTLTLNKELFDQLTADRGWRTNAQRAAGIGVTEATISRARTGRTAPGATLIAKATAALNVSVEQLFPMVSPGDAYIERIKVLVQHRPPLSDSQRTHLAMLLNPIVDSACVKTEAVA